MCSAFRVAIPLALVALSLVLGCGPRATKSEAPAGGDAAITPAIIVADGGSGGPPESSEGEPAEPPKEAPAVKAEAPPANARLLLGKPFAFEGDDEVELTLTGIVAETIEASPEDPESYPGGSGVTVSLNLNSEERQEEVLNLARLSAGYTSRLVVWIDMLRIELRAVEDDAVELFVARQGEVLQDPPPKRVTILKDQDVALDEGVAVRLIAHGHKRTHVDGPASPLLVTLQYTLSSGERVEQGLSISPEGTGWSWRDFDFRIVKVDYGESMEVDVGHRALTPLKARESRGA